MKIVQSGANDLDALLTLQVELWPDATIEEQREELALTLARRDGPAVVFLALDETGSSVGFAQAAIRSDYVNGCDTSPVTFLEGIYVRSSHRGRGVGRALCAAVEDWGRQRGCTELGSDAPVGNVESEAFHLAAGFEERERVVYFRKLLAR